MASFLAWPGWALIAQKSISYLAGNYVFLDAKQRPIDQEIFRQKAWAPVLKRLGIRYRPPYQMRHSFATLALSLGENPNWVSRMLGHQRLTTTEKYVQSLGDGQREAAKLLKIKTLPATLPAKNEKG